MTIDPDEDDYAGLSSVQFLRYASRLPCYDGAVAAAFRRRREDTQPDSAPAVAGMEQQPTSHLDASPLNLRTNPLLTQFIDYG